MDPRLLDLLEPLRSTDWSTWPCTPVGLLAPIPSFDRRYGSVPPEAVPVLDLGVDGCHYAIWLDDPSAADVEPVVVQVLPMDSHPDRISLVAPSIREFRSLLRPDDDWLIRSEPAIDAHRREARRIRSELVVARTMDGLGVVDAVADAAHPEALNDASLVIDRLHELLASGHPSNALVLARDAIALDLIGPKGLGNAIASVYRALGRSEYAEVAIRSYEPTSEQLERRSRIAALRKKYGK